MKHVVIIGAGLGGLAAALRLRSMGHRVTIFENNDSPGGKIQEYERLGFRFDTGPSLLTMPEVLEELYSYAGERMEDYLELVEPEPVCRYFYQDGTIFDNYRDIHKSLAEIGTFAPEERVAYSNFLNYSKRIYEKTADPFLFNPLFDVRDLTNLKLTDIFRIDAFKTVSDEVNEVFQSDYLRKFFKRFATYNGSSPYKAPATMNVIAHVEITKGGFYIKGGMYRIVESLERLLVRKGIDIHYNSTVNRIVIRKKKVAGVTLENGDSVDCDIVLSNTDTAETMLNLIEREHLGLSVIRKHKKVEPSCSGFVLLLGTMRKWNQLRHHNIFFSGDYRAEFEAIFGENKLPSDPTIYVTNTSYTDSEDAPDGGSNLFVLVNAPYVSDGQNWDRIEAEYPGLIVKKLEQAGLDGLSESIKFRETITPVDFQTRYRSNRGSIYGTSSNGRLAAFVRPRNKVRQIDGLYLAGGSTHPGGGIPLVLLSARHAVTLMKRYEGL